MSRDPDAPGCVPALSVDLNELTMAQAYLDEGMDQPATFSLFARKLPLHHGYFVAAGLEDVLEYLETLRFSTEDLAYLERTRLFSPRLLDLLAAFRFSGSVWALPEGTVCAPQEPLLELTAPIIQAQIVESALVNMVHFQTIIASKAARCVEAAAGRTLVEFGLRRIHGLDSALRVARCCALVGFASTSNVRAGQVFGIPLAGTMAHSFVQCHASELDAFRAFGRAFPDTCVLLLDTYDTRSGARNAVIAGRELRVSGHALRGVRLDSGDLLSLSKSVRDTLDAAGFHDAIIFASGSLDEFEIARLLQAGAPIDAFGVGTKLGVAADAPYLDMAYKLVDYAGEPTMKLSTGKATWPGSKQVWRHVQEPGLLADTLSLRGEAPAARGIPLLRQVMVDGERTEPAESWREIQARFQEQQSLLPAAARRLTDPESIPLEVSSQLGQVQVRLELQYARQTGA